MAVIKIKDIKNLNENELEEKLKELKLELIKNKAKKGKVKEKEIKKAIARILTTGRLMLKHKNEHMS